MGLENQRDRGRALARATPTSLTLELTGALQGIGFRPWFANLARRLQLSGRVCNTRWGVEAHLTGTSEQVEELVSSLREDPFVGPRIEALELRPSIPTKVDGFHIAPSSTTACARGPIPLDTIICASCRAEVLEPSNRRYRYAFTACARCGPRYTVSMHLPYDRERTSLGAFPMCQACKTEYEDATDRRYHAQGICCPRCGPSLSAHEASGALLAEGDAALNKALDVIRDGGIVAGLGLGGFQLWVDATNHEAVARLRTRKRRPDKPFALLMGSVASTKQLCRVSEAEAAWLKDPAGPIVLLQRLKTARRCVADLVAPGSPELGVMLPTTGLHALLATDLDRPLIATSGNVSGRPLCGNPDQARHELGAIADLFLSHDRVVQQPADDPVMRVVDGQAVWFRSGRGTAPLDLRLPRSGPRPVLACGAHLKNTVALASQDRLLVSPHIGDLDDVAAWTRHSDMTRTLLRWRGSAETVAASASGPTVACDAHPDYASTQIAEDLAAPEPPNPVWHHLAHAAAVMAEHGLTNPVTALVWDGSGLGTDGTLWGGELLHVDGTEFQRLGYIHPFALLGGERAILEPRLTAISLLVATMGEEAWRGEDLQRVTGLERAEATRLFNAPTTMPTNAAGRLFDGIAALLGVRQRISYEAQAAVELEWLADEDAAPYPVPNLRDPPWVFDWRPMVHRLWQERRQNLQTSLLAGRFIATLVEAGVAMVRQAHPSEVILCGGCFLNRKLLSPIRRRLIDLGYQVYLPRRLPMGDGAIAAGQAWITTMRQARWEGV